MTLKYWDIVTGSIDDMVDELESKLLQALNIYAPEITKTVTVRHRLPWYTDKNKRAKKKNMQKGMSRAKIYKLKSNWIALKEERT